MGYFVHYGSYEREGKDTFTTWLIEVEPASLLGDLASTGETLERNAVSEAAHRTPPGKDAAERKSTSRLAKGSFFAIDITFFQQQAM
jgi:hypothetical protein